LIEIFDKKQKPTKSSSSTTKPDILPPKPKDRRLFAVKKLPGKVRPDLCHYRLKKDVCILVLHKAVKGSWKNALSLHGLETYSS
jgi:hypothetical protein